MEIKVIQNLLSLLLHSLLLLQDYITRRIIGSISDSTAFRHSLHFVYFKSTAPLPSGDKPVTGSGTLLPEGYRFIPLCNIFFGGTPTTVHDLAHTSRAIGDWWDHVTSVHDATVLSNAHGQCSPAFSAEIT